ncbi:membrane lipoprotein lipid attachment site-containing protein [Aliarcobacter cryaerophilus]|uniref:Membrane lipoprotein lipid attachment site-containing protein n=1 Tax=Aliarcobacter cryaerophilus TaxID=28198 RepID=A0A7G9LMA7_9BACT|nr:membrane lipoprotein lipid attachment site-containing protein [Aliarcobacter cryaerophilus]QNM89756.1 membrane lipoprotein lipid attachment site-containing protein [Aliarcobacter cryaerophilus]
MKKIIFGMAISLAFLLSGCSENELEKQGKEAFKQNVEIDFDKAKKEALKTFSNEQIQKWIDEDPRIKEIEKSYIEYNNKKNKHIDFSKFDWSLKPDDKVKK